LSTGLIMMLKSLGLDPKMLESVARAVQTAAGDLHTMKLNQQILLRQNEEILIRLRALTPDVEIPKEVPRLELVTHGG
jgi:hypothetical protein